MRWHPPPGGCREAEVRVPEKGAAGACGPECPADRCCLAEISPRQGVNGDDEDRAEKGRKPGGDIVNQRSHGAGLR